MFGDHGRMFNNRLLIEIGEGIRIGDMGQPNILVPLSTMTKTEIIYPKNVGA